MGYGVAVNVFGEYACFTRPDFKVERVSYDVITPSAARGILEAIYWSPGITWKIDKIHVLNEIKYISIKRNEVGQKIPQGKIKAAMKSGSSLYQVAADIRQQRVSTILKDVSYIIEAHFEMNLSRHSVDPPEKHYQMIMRRLRKGSCYYQPYLGNREFGAGFRAVNGHFPKSFYHGTEVDLGWMLWDIDYQNNMEPIFFRAIMKNGIIVVPDLLKKG